jgi:hypothetical protein
MKKSKSWWKYKEIGRWIVVVLGVILIYKFVKGDSLIEVIRRSLPPEEAGVLGGIILGDKSGFSKDFYQYLKDSGLVHLVVVSGSNVMLLVGGVIETMAGGFGTEKDDHRGSFVGVGVCRHGRVESTGGSGDAVGDTALFGPIVWEKI